MYNAPPFRSESMGRITVDQVSGRISAYSSRTAKSSPTPRKESGRLAEARRGAQLPFPCNIPVDVLVEIVSESKTSSSFIPIFQSGKTSQELKKEITFQHQE